MTGDPMRRTIIKKVRAAPRRAPTCWTIAFGMVLGFVISEMQHREIGPFRDLTWKSHNRKSMAPLVAEPLLQMPPMPPPTGEAPAAAAAAAARAAVAESAVRSRQTQLTSAAQAPAASAAQAPAALLKVKSSAQFALVHSQPWVERTFTSSLLMYVGHMRRFEYVKSYHNTVVSHMTSMLGKPPTVCIVTYSSRDHEDSAHKNAYR
jgi:hypothetical protein